ncbi:hypothetical protein ACFW04_014726 [Cataglyphis niger]
MKGWIYKLSKAQLIEIADERGLDTSDTMDDIRRRMAGDVDAHPEEYATGSTGTTENETGQNEPATDTTNVVKQMRKWGAGYAFPESAMLRGLPELLRGDALQWYRNNKHRWENWGQFDHALRTQFLPRRYRATLRREISDRRQRPGESFKKYVGDILTLMRRTGGFAAEEKYERIYENMRAEIKRYVRYNADEGIDELQMKVTEQEEIEELCRQEQKTDRAENAKPNVATVYNKKECCWRCKQRGHTRRTCKRPPRKFCSQCGQDGSATIPGTITAPVHIRGETLQHKFAILPRLESPVLMGVDLWAQTMITLDPPRTETQRKSNPTRCTATRGLTTRTTNEKEKLQEFLRKELKNNAPIKQRYRPRNPAMQAVIDQEVEDMEVAGVIEPSTSAWSSPVILVKKKDGKYRFCIDFRKVNDATEKDAYPLSQVTATLEKLRGAKYLSTLDFKQGYWQVPLESKSRPITAFTIPGRGLYQFKVMPFGLHSAPATFQRLLDKIISPALEPNVFVYLDDIIVISKTFDDHLRLLTEVFRRLRDARLRLNPDKCKFCVDRLKIPRACISAVENWPEPRTVKQVRQFLGMASWYRRFIANFWTIAAPLTNLTRKNAKWKWGIEETTAFRELKKTLVSAPVLACPDFARRFILQTDASTSGLGAVLTQNFEEGERVIAYASRTLNSAEKNYSATELECLAVVWGIRRMKGYLEGYPFTVITDHQALKWLQRLEAPTGRLARWLFELQQYDLEVKYRKGTLNRVADALSRQPEVCVAKPRRSGWYQRVLEETERDPPNRPDFRIQNGKLYKHILHSLNFKETSAEEQWKECVPKKQRTKILNQHHNEPTAGHLGIAKTIARIAEHFY